MAWGVFHTWPRIIQAQVVSTRKRLVQNGAGNHNSGFSSVLVLVNLHFVRPCCKFRLNPVLKPNSSQHLQLNIDCTELANFSSFVKCLRRSTKQYCVYGSGATSFSEVAQSCLLYHTWQTLFPEFSSLKKKQPYTTIFLSSPYKKKNNHQPVFSKTPHWPKSSSVEDPLVCPTTDCISGCWADAWTGSDTGSLAWEWSILVWPVCRFEAGQGHPNLFFIKIMLFTRGDVEIMSNWFFGDGSIVCVMSWKCWSCFGEGFIFSFPFGDN